MSPAPLNLRFCLQPRLARLRQPTKNRLATLPQKRNPENVLWIILEKRLFRGGWTTKLHAACADERVAVSLCLSGGQRHDTTAFADVWREVPKTRWLNAAVMDKAYDCDDIRKFLEYQGIEAVIPPKSNRKMLFPYDKTKYRMRQKVERFFCRIKEFRRIATRYDKLAKTIMAFVHLVCAFIAFQST